MKRHLLHIHSFKVNCKQPFKSHIYQTWSCFALSRTVDLHTPVQLRKTSLSLSFLSL